MVTLKKFTAAWCGPCRSLGPLFTEIKNEFKSVTFEEYDVDVAYAAATEYAVRSLPTIVILKNGEEVERFTGVVPKSTYTKALNAYLN